MLRHGENSRSSSPVVSSPLRRTVERRSGAALVANSLLPRAGQFGADSVQYTWTKRPIMQRPMPRWVMRSPSLSCGRIPHVQPPPENEPLDRPLAGAAAAQCRRPGRVLHAAGGFFSTDGRLARGANIAKRTRQAVRRAGSSRHEAGAVGPRPSSQPGVVHRPRADAAPFSGEKTIGVTRLSRMGEGWPGPSVNVLFHPKP